MESLKGMDVSEIPYENGSLQVSDDAKEHGDVGDGLLEDLDSYLQDINDRLTISRMVSDSIIKGMVNAVSQETDEKVAQKELEIAQMNEMLHLYHVGTEKNEFLRSPLMTCEFKCKLAAYSSMPVAFVEYDKLKESLGSLRNSTKMQFKRLRKELDSIRGRRSVRRVSSGSELVGLGGILQEKVLEKQADIDESVDGLEATVDTIYRGLENIFQFSKASICQWQDEKEFQADIESMVIRNSIRSLKEEYEERLWNQNVQFLNERREKWIEKINEITSLRRELDVISRSLSAPEIGHLHSHSSLETDNFHNKIVHNRGSPAALTREGNGKHEEPKMSENLDPSQLRHLDREELISHYSVEMTKMRRQHESQVQEITEDYFTLKREIFKMASSLSLKKEKEIEILKRKIPDILLKLDGILVENENLPEPGTNEENVGSLRERLGTLLSENRHLRGVLEERTNDVKSLSSQVSDAAETMAQHSLLKETGNLKCEIQDADIEASVAEQVYKCFPSELTGKIKCMAEESNLGYNIIQDIYEIMYQEAAHNAEPSGKLEIEDSDMECTMTQGILGVILGESLKEVAEKWNCLKQKYNDENKARIALEMEALENEEALRVAVKEIESLKENIISLRASVEEKEHLANEIASLVKEKEQLESASQELAYLRDQISQQQRLILESNTISSAIKEDLAMASEKVELLKMENCDLNKKFEQALKELSKVDEQRRMLLLVAQEYQNFKSSVKAEERECQKQTESMIIFIKQLSKEIANFEYTVMQSISENSKRLKGLSSQSRLLIQSASKIRKTELTYKERLDRRCADLQKAEEEVDLLGDEVDMLLSLLEKIYIALDHYSPILQHYPGIVDILKLVRRELSEDSTKAVG